MAYAYQSRIKRGQKMPHMCELCNSIHKNRNAGTEAEQNACFVPRKKYEGLPVDQQLKFDSYAPFVNSKRTIVRTCQNFAHVKSVREW